MPIVMHFSESVDENPRRVLSRFGTHLKHAYNDAVLYWHMTYAPLHFQSVAYVRYPGEIALRTNTHIRRKLAMRQMSRETAPARRGAHSRDPMPNEMTGALKASVLGSIRPSSTSKALKGALHGPAYMNRPKGNVRTYKELVAVNEQELKTLAKRVEADIMRAMENPDNHKRRIR